MVGESINNNKKPSYGSQATGIPPSEKEEIEPQSNQVEESKSEMAIR